MSDSKTGKTVLTYAVSVAIALAVGGLSALLGKPGMEAFKSLAKPPLSPPPMVFMVVWSALFVLMGISAAMVYLARGEQRNEALVVYALQLAVNFFWTILFFAKAWRFFAFLWLLLLIFLIALMIRKFSRVSRPAALLQIPYLVWACFAAYLNFGVWYLNR